LKIKNLLVSQPKPTTEKSPYFDLAEKYSLKIDFRPFIKVEGLSAKDFRQQKISIPDHTAVVFTARHGIDHFFRLCEEMRITISEEMKYFCVNEQVALYLQKYIVYRKRKIFHTTSGKNDELIQLIMKHSGESYLVPVSDVSKDDLTVRMDEKKITYSKAVMYCTVSNDFQPGELFNYDMLVFFSPSGIASLLKNFPDFEQGEISIGCFGATTAQAVREAGLRLDCEAPTAESPSMTSALDLYIKENHKLAKKI
jgi:uroporphyrinogen-III synthase